MDIANRDSFIAIRVIERKRGGKGSWLSLYRNRDWISYDGKRLHHLAYGITPQLHLSMSKFTKLNNDADSSSMRPSKRRGEIAHALGAPWYAIPDGRKSGPWAYRNIFALRSHFLPESGAQIQLSARLIQFTVTEREYSRKPAVFDVRRNGFDRFWIDMAGPGFTRPEEAEFRIGSKCKVN